jgi:hypothetical protein
MGFICLKGTLLDNVVHNLRTRYRKVFALFWHLVANLKTYYFIAMLVHMCVRLVLSCDC